MKSLSSFPAAFYLSHSNVATPAISNIYSYPDLRICAHSSFFLRCQPFFMVRTPKVLLLNFRLPWHSLTLISLLLWMSFKGTTSCFFYALQRIIWSSFLLKLYSGAISVTTVSTTISCLDATPLLQYYYTLFKLGSQPVFLILQFQDSV